MPISGQDKPLESLHSWRVSLPHPQDLPQDTRMRPRAQETHLENLSLGRSVGCPFLLSLSLLLSLTSNRKSVSLRSWAATEVDGFVRKGWLHKRLTGKNRFVSCWVELYESCEVPHHRFVCVLTVLLTLDRKHVHRQPSAGPYEEQFSRCVARISRIVTDLIPRLGQHSRQSVSRRRAE